MKFKRKPFFKSCCLAQTCHIFVFQMIGYIYIIDFLPIRKIHINSAHGNIEVLSLIDTANLTEIHRSGQKYDTPTKYSANYYNN